MEIKKMWYNFKYAYKGVTLLVKENSFQWMVGIGILVIIAGLILKISYEEWLIVLICIIINLSLEGINTVWEKTLDYLESRYSLPVKDIKDLIAGTVLVTSFITVIIGLIIFTPKIMQLLTFYHG